MTGVQTCALPISVNGIFVLPVATASSPLDEEAVLLVIGGVHAIVGAALPGRMRPAKEVRETCPLQLPEPGRFRAIIQRQGLPQL